ncbi:hypothetical protein AHAS_Ahas12G0030000 [Arachis hypogaea]
MRPVFAGNLEYDTRQSELERLFSKYGRIDRVDMKSACLAVTISDLNFGFKPYNCNHDFVHRRNFAFVQFETQEDAVKALECMNMSKILDRVVSVEYALRDDGDRGDNYDSRRQGGYDRSPSLAYHRRPSPEYGHPRIPVYDRYNGPDRRRSPDYGRQRNPDYGRYRSRSPARRPRN